MNEHGGVEVCDMDDARCGGGWDQGLSVILADEAGASGTFETWASVDDLGASETIVWSPGDSGLRVSLGHYWRACEAKPKLTSAGDVRLAPNLVNREVAAVGRDGHHVRECDARGLGQHGDQDQRGEYGDF